MKYKSYLCLFFMVFLVSCSVLQMIQNYTNHREPSFPHIKHLTGDNKMECTDCHEDSFSQDKAGMPSIQLCKDCHEDNETSRPIAYSLLKKLEATGKEKPWSEIHLDSEIIFSHKKHIDKKIDCSTCHQNIMQSEFIDNSVLPKMEKCNSCHEVHNKEMTGCQDCHKETRRDIKPVSHRQNWKVFHGSQMFLSDKSEQRQCTFCHGKEGCNDCHQSQKPASHTNFWSRTAHGLHASVDRDRCIVCHKADFCTRCHQETKPRTHTAGWGSSRNRHCLSCHEANSSISCYVCHQNTNSHVSYATPKPSNPAHDTASAAQCRACHITLKHPDNGQNCRICHK